MSVLREKILTSAAHLFQTRGINATGVDAIVAEAGTTKMTLYKHFNSKETLILEVLKRSQLDFQSWLDAKLNRTQASEKIQILFDFIEEWIESHPQNGMAFLQASSEFPAQTSAIHQLSSTQSQAFRQYVTGIAKQADIADAAGLAMQLSMLIEGAMQAEQLQRGSGGLKYAKKAAHILIKNAQKT